MRIRRNANAAVGLALLVIGAVALLAGMDTPATGGDRVVILDDDGRVIREIDIRAIERMAEDMGELGAEIAEDVARMLEDMDVEVDGHSGVWIHGDDGDQVYFDAERFERNMERFARRLEERLSHLEDHDFEQMGRMAERIHRRVEREVERALRGTERHEHRDHVDRYDRREEREFRRDDDAAAIRDEIRVLERQLERLQRRLERLEDR